MNNFLSGLSKTLKIVQDIIPIYNDTKPVINKVKNTLSNKSDINKKRNNKIATQQHKKITTNTSSNPKFFI